MIVAKIDVSKIDKAHLFEGKKGKYLDIALHEKPNEYGDDGFITQSVSKEARDKGIKGGIIGNWKTVGQKAPQGRSTQRQSASTPSKLETPLADDDQSLPF